MKKTCETCKRWQVEAYGLQGEKGIVALCDFLTTYWETNMPAFGTKNIYTPYDFGCKEWKSL